jgi:hypothetical protein
LLIKELLQLLEQAAIKTRQNMLGADDRRLRTTCDLGSPLQQQLFKTLSGPERNRACFGMN